MFMIIMYWLLMLLVCSLVDLTLFHFLRALGTLHDHVCGCVISSDKVQPAIRHNMPGASFWLLWMEVTWLHSSHLSLCVIYVHESIYMISTLCHAWMLLFPWKCFLIPVPFLICSGSYCSVVTGVLCMCLVFYITNLLLFVTLTM